MFLSPPFPRTQNSAARINVRMMPLTMVPVMLSNGFILPSIAGLVVVDTPCAPVPERTEKTL